MTDRRLWKLLRWAARIIGGLATAAVIELTLFLVLESRLSSVYGDSGMVPGMKRQLAVSVAVMLGLLAVVTLMTRRALGTDSWREAMRWTATSFRQGAKVGAVVVAVIAVATLLVMGLWARGFMA